jgi:hypothetical protein
MARRLSSQLWFRIYQRDGFRCQYCGVPATDAPLHIDHIQPVRASGSDDTNNLTLACDDCNFGKSGYELPERHRLELTTRAHLRDILGPDQVCTRTLGQFIDRLWVCSMAVDDVDPGQVIAEKLSDLIEEWPDSSFHQFIESIDDYLKYIRSFEAWKREEGTLQ